jgi:hypothetical protein
MGYGSSRTLCSAGVGPEALRFSGLASNSVRGGSVTRGIQGILVALVRN